MTSDLDLLGQYARGKSQAAFTALVNRHVNLVYSAALRQVRSSQLAEEVAQSVFADLARNADKLATGGTPVLIAWLYSVTRRTAIDVIRKESRRQLREQIAVEMNAMNATANEWTQIEPLLDDAMAALDETDRSAILLRFFENKSLREVGTALGTSDDAAQKRVSRAVEQLREFFAKRGAAVGAGGLAVVISANAVQAAPVGLAVTISTAALAGTAATTSTLIAATTKTIAMTTLQKIVITGALVVGVASCIAFYFSRSNSEITANALQRETGLQADSQMTGAVIHSDDDAATQTLPDPVKLLRTVMRARTKISSGAIDFQYSLERFNKGRKETNQLRFAATFDGDKLRFESFGREFAYAFDEDETKQNDIIKGADSMNKQAAVNAGLLNEFKSHHVMVRDAKVLYDFWDAGNQSPRTVIDDVAKGTGNHIFDPRCVGLTTFLNVDGSVESCLVAKKAKLVGEESIDGIPAFHVCVEFDSGVSLDYWIDKDRPERLIQHTYGLDIVKSRFDEVNLNDPIPVEVNTMSFRNGTLEYSSQLLRSKVSYNVPVDQTNFSLAGLGMPVGTEVSDNRIHRMIGYWNGFGLSENLPKTSELSPTNSLKPDNRLILLGNDPASPEALESAVWIILNTPDGTEVGKAAEAILNFHTTDTNLIPLCLGLERLRPSCATNLLAAILQDNPSVGIRGNACFALATILKSQAKYGTNLVATAEAVKQYERIINEFSAVKQRGDSLAELAKPELYELQRLTIGKPAPDTSGVDMDGNPLKLSDYRGQVTVIVFWSAQFSEVTQFRKLKEEMAGKPFALIGVNSDEEYSVHPDIVEKVNWPSFRDGRDGLIAKLWNSHCWPDIWVLDRQGIIRYRGLAVHELKSAVNKLLAE